MYKNVELKVSGRLLRGSVITPEGEGPFPAVIFYHGFTVDRVGMQRLHLLFAREVVKAGFACVRFDFYGLGESEGDFSEMTLGHEIEEAEAIYHWTRQQDFCKPDEVFISGHSQGGLICTLIAPKLQPKAMVLWSPALNQYYGASLRARTMMGPTEKGWDIEGLELSHEFIEEIRKMDLRSMACGYYKPTILIHGTLDELVPVDVVDVYQDIYGDCMKKVLIEGANHQFRSLKWKQQVYDESVKFLKQQLS